MIRINFVAITLALIFTGCATTAPTSVKESFSAITITKDKFNNLTTIETPLYLSKKEFTDPFPVRLKYRAFYAGSERKLIQLYVSVPNIEWGFYDRASGEDGESLTVHKIDSLVGSVGSIVTTEELLGLKIHIDYLKDMGKADFSIKLYGKRNSGDFVVPSSLTKAFIQKLNCFEDKGCT
jgi:hypothetical protein